MIDIQEVADIYAEPGYMDPRDFEELSLRYGRSRRWVIYEGTLLDAQVLFDTDMEGMPVDERPTIIVRPVAVNEWASTYQARAWEHEDTPQQVWDLIEIVLEYEDDPAEGDDTQELEEIYEMLDVIFELE